MTRTVARWESRSRKHWLEVEAWAVEAATGGMVTGFGFRHSAGGGTMPRDVQTLSAAVEYVERRILPIVQPDANKTPMRRVR